MSTQPPWPPQPDPRDGGGAAPPPGPFNPGGGAPQGGHPPPQGGPGGLPQGGYPPEQGGYPPEQGGYPPQQGGFPPQQGGYPPQQGGYPPQQGGYPPQQGGFPPQQGGYPPQQGGYPPQSGGGAPPLPWQPAPHKRSKGPLIAGLVVLLILVVGVAAVIGLRFLRGSADTIATNVPSDVIAYGHLNLNPSAGNKLGILSLIDRVNEAAGEDLIDIDAVLEDIEMDADGISFAEDIDPWLGDQVALYATAFPTTDPETFETTQPVFAAVLTLDDVDAAVEFIEDQDPLDTWDAGEDRQGWLVEGQDADDENAVVIGIDGDRLYVGVPEAVRAGLDTDDSLADTERYRTAVDQLPDRVLTLWADAPAIVDSIVASTGQMMPAGQDIPESAAIAISFSEGAVDITTVATAADGDAVVGERIAPADFAALPAGGLLYVGIPDAGEQIPRALDGADDSARETAEQSGEPLGEDELPSAQVDRELDALFGTSVAEISQWMGDMTMMVAYDPRSATDNAAMLMQVAVADEGAARDLVNAGAADLDGEEGVEVADGSVTSGDVRLAVADANLALTIGSPGEEILGDDEAYQAAIDGVDGEPVVYLDIRRMVETIAAFAFHDAPDDPMVEQVIDVAGAFDSLVATYVVDDGGVTRSVLRVLFASELEPVPAGGDEPHLPDLDLGPLGTFEAIVEGGSGGGLGGMFEPPVAATPEEELAELEIDLIDAGFLMETDYLVDGSYVPPVDPFATFLPGSIIDPAVVEPEAYCLVGITASGAALIYDSVTLAVTAPTGDPYAACEDAVRDATASAPSPPPTDVAFTYGDDPALDVLWDACADGDFGACDALFDAAESETDYELFALTCGDRNDPAAEFCVDVYAEGE